MDLIVRVSLLSIDSSILLYSSTTLLLSVFPSPPSSPLPLILHHRENQPVDVSGDISLNAHSRSLKVNPIYLLKR